MRRKIVLGFCEMLFAMFLIQLAILAKLNGWQVGDASLIICPLFFLSGACRVITQSSRKEP